MSNSIAPGSSADVNVRVTALTTNPNVPAQYKTIILKKNLVNGVNTLTQEMMSSTNTKYVIKYDYVLGEDITVPANCVLEFDGGSIENNNNNTYCLVGNVLNNILYAKWFSDDTTLIKSINNLNGYSIIYFEKEHTYTFIEEISPKHSVVIEGNNSIIKRDNIGTTSKPAVNISPITRVNNVTIKNIKFDGGVVQKSYRESDTRFDIINIENVDNIILYNITFVDFNIPAYTGENSIETDYAESTTFIQIKEFHNINMDSVVFDSNWLYGETVCLYPVDRNVDSKDTVIIENCLFNNVKNYSALNCFGKLIFQNNEVHNCSGSALNAFVTNSVISDNLFMGQTRSTIIDVSEQGLFENSQNVYINNNIVKDCNSGLFQGVKAKNIIIENNICDFSDKNQTGITLENCKDIVVKGNKISGVGRVINLSGDLTENIQVTDNIFSFDATENDFVSNYINVYQNNNNISIERNYFKLTVSDTASIQQVIKITANDSIMSNFSICDNVFNLPPITDIVNTFRGETLNTYNRFKVRNNFSINYGTIYINHKTSNLIDCFGNGENISVQEFINSDYTVIAGYSIIIDHRLTLNNNAKIIFEANTSLTFTKRAELFGGNIQTHNSTRVFGIPYTFTSTLIGTSYFFKSSRPQNVIPGTIYFDGTLNKPIWWDGTAWVDATGATV